MKNILKLFFVLLCLFGFRFDVNASEVTWEDITNAWEELESNDEDSTVEINASDTNLNYMSTSGDSDFRYFADFTYGNNIIDFVVQDRRGLPNYDKVVYSLYDNTLIYYMLNIISQLNDVEYTSLDENKLDDYGIVYESVDVSYEEEGLSMSSSEIISFSVDLDKFEEGTRYLKGDSGDNNGEDDNLDDDIVVGPNTSDGLITKVGLSLEKANIDSLELSVDVSDLSENSAVCYIYLISEDNTSGSSKLVGTIDNCVNGNNKYVVSNLESNTKYTFQVVLEEDAGNDTSNVFYGDKNYSFSTIKNDKADVNIDVLDKVEEITNPKTGDVFIIFVIGCLVMSLVSFVLMYRQVSKN